MIELKAIHLTYNRGEPLEKKVLSGIDLKVQTGEVLVIIGGNGSGKSSLMNVIAGELKVDSGAVFIDGQKVTKKDVQERSSLVSRVFQDPLAGTCADLTIEENLSLAYFRGQKRLLMPALTASRREEFRERLAELHMGLENRLSDPVGLLSGGQRQALSLIMATLQPSKILLLDEPTAALDPRMSRKVMDLAEKIIQKYKLTSILITHSPQQALHFGTQTIVLQNGRIARTIDAEERKHMSIPDLVAIYE